MSTLDRLADSAVGSASPIISIGLVAEIQVPIDDKIMPANISQIYPTLVSVISPTTAASYSRYNTVYNQVSIDRLSSLRLGVNGGICVTGSNVTRGAGLWEYFNAETSSQWVPVPDSLSITSCLILGLDDKLRFTPLTKVNGLVTLAFVAWDGAGGYITGNRATVAFDNPHFGNVQESFQLDIQTASQRPILTNPTYAMPPIAYLQTTAQTNFCNITLQIRSVDYATVESNLLQRLGLVLSATIQVVTLHARGNLR